MENWQQHNYDKLMAEIVMVKQALRVNPQKQSDLHVVAQKPELRAVGEQPTTSTVSDIPMTRATCDELPEQTSVMLDNLCGFFGLSLFERQLLVLCAGMELDPQLPSLCGELNRQPHLTLELMLTVFNGHWSALTPESPLCYYHLITQQQDNQHVVRQSLTITPWTLFYLTGTPSLDPLLTPWLNAVPVLQPRLDSHENSSKQLYRAWQQQSEFPTVVQLITSTGDEHRQVTALAAEQGQSQVYELNLYNLPLRHDELDYHRRLLEREVTTRQCWLLIDCQRLQQGGESESDLYPLRSWLDRLIQNTLGRCVLAARQVIHLPITNVQYQYLPTLPQTDQITLWQHYLGDAEMEQTSELNKTLQRLSTQFNLTGQQVRGITHAARQVAHTEPNTLEQQLWQHSREQSRQDLQGLARVINPVPMRWEDLILPLSEINTLRTILDQVSQQQRVYQQWGFAKQVPYGLGISVLLAGSSGTGKTMAARIIASQLQLDLYHIDLSNVVDKYIGETEKNLDKIFQAAEDSGAVLLFDEADALFGKRSKVQDSRDRYSNMSVSFLLQRMESYSGLSILTTNLRSAMDDAFLRRIRFIIQFPFPDETQRKKIWQCLFPDTAPTVNLDYNKLARLILAGGSIRNIVLQAAFNAAAEQQDINMQHLLTAVRQDYIKAEKTLDEKLVKDW